jgi:hypothetical protein
MVTEAGSPRRPPLTQGATSAAWRCYPFESKGRTIGDHLVFSIGGRWRGKEASVRRRGGGGGRMHRQAFGVRGRTVRSRGQGGVVPRTPRAVACLFGFARFSARVPCFGVGYGVFHPRHARELGSMVRSVTS